MYRASVPPWQQPLDAHLFPPFWFPPNYHAPPGAGAPPGVTLPPTMLGGLATRMDTDDSDSLATDQDTPRSPKGKKRMRDDQEDDYVDLLSNAEALGLVEFDPAVDPKDSWVPPKIMVDFLTKHFNRSLSDAERQAILSDFPKPLCDAVALPKMDDDVKKQLKSRGKDPHYGSEKCLYKLQEQVLEVVGPLTCLWADMLNKDATIKVEDTLLLIQRALFF